MNTKAKKLDQLHLEYEALLVQELEGLIPLATLHGWSSQLYPKGKELRAKLVKAGSKIKLPECEQ